jgi:predicted  nucleic acid-binding Zn-ribbon protein
MRTQQSVIFEFRQLTKFLIEMSERQQVTTLKFELFHALERAHDFQDRSRAAERRIAELEAQISDPDGAKGALVKHLRGEFVRVGSELVEARSQHESEIRSLRVELTAAETLCEALDELCRSLLVTFEQTAEPDDEERAADSDVAREAQVSAS